MIKQLTALLTAFALAGTAAPADTVSSAEPEGISFICEKDGDNVIITGYTGSDSILIIPETIDGSPVKAIGDNVFSGMKELTAVIIPDTVVSIGDRSFSACPDLCTVSLGVSLNSIGEYAFSACPQLTEFTTAPGSLVYSTYGGSLTTDYGAKLVVYAGDSEAVIPGGIRTVEKGAFMGKTGLVSVSVPDSVRGLGDFAFSGCTSLKSVSLPDSVTDMGAGCFMSCSELGEVKLGSGIDEIRDNVFNSCSSLWQINISENVTAIGSQAFFGCPELNGIYIPETVTSIGDMAIGQHYDLRSGGISNISGFVLHGDEGSAAGGYAVSSGIEIRPFLPGDIDDSGAVDGSDATLALKEYSYRMHHRDSTLNIYGRLAGDFDQNGIIDGSDATLILKEYGRQSAGTKH